MRSRLPATLPLPAAWLLATLLAAAPSGASGLRFELAGDGWGVGFRHHHGGSGEFYMVETMSSGVVIFDYDDDGDADLFFVDGGALPGYEGEAPRSRLYRNESQAGGGAPRFVDVTGGSGLAVAAYGMGAVAGDVDGDGDLDLYVTAFGANQLFENRGDGTFADVTAEAGVGDPLWSASAAFGDADGDGDLDLYVANYVDFTLETNQICGVITRRLRSYCHPDAYDAVPDRFYLNRGDGTFEDATRAAGLADLLGKGLGVVWSDLDGDGDQDVYVANDMTFNLQLENLGPGDGVTVRFEDVALLTGTAVGDLGQPEAGMGIGVRDLDGDALPELYVTHLDRQTNALYSGRGAVFVDRRFESGLAEPAVFKVGFGAAFADFDHDGDADLAVANGHVTHNVELHGTGSTYRQKNQVFENVGGGRFREVDAGLDAELVSRGLATGDLDGDGDLDLVITNSNGATETYENAGAALDWLKLDLAAARGNRQAVGARVELSVGDLRQIQEVRTGSSYLSQNDLTLHFGLGGKGGAPELRVRLAGGRTLRARNLPRNRRLRLAVP